MLDILKPGPIGWLDKNLKGGLGIMADDLAAGVVTAVGIHGLLLLIWGFELLPDVPLVLSNKPKSDKVLTIAR